MNKIPAKQIYLLTIIIVGIISLSVYSTYALFTFESSTSDIVSIHTPKSLQISENIYEYQQITIEPNSVTTTDIDIYNTFEYNVCYSIWYRIVGDIDENTIQVFQKSNDNLTSSGVLPQLEKIRITIAIINDNEEPVKINIGTIGEQMENGTCSLNLSSDRNVISSNYGNIENLSKKLLKEVNNIKKETSNYITYTDETEIITYKDSDEIYISDKFNYNDELFTLEEPLHITIEELIKEKYLDEKDIYFCKEDKECTILYKMTEIKQQEIEKEILETIPEEKLEFFYDITKYDKLIGYLGGDNGLRKVNKKDYVFYGDNPNNYVYYNCQNIDDTSTCELWRIIGLYYNEEKKEYNLKLIRKDSIGKYAFDDSEQELITWPNSTLHKYLNEEYKFLNNYDIFLEEYKQKIEILTEKETKEETINSKINLLNLSEYLQTSSCDIKKLSEVTEKCLKNNWLNDIEIKETWTTTQKEIETIIEIEQSEETPEDEKITNENNEEESIVETETQPVIEEEIIISNYAYSIGNTILETKPNELLEVRPTIYLKSRMLLVGGEGTFDNPYIIK